MLLDPYVRDEALYGPEEGLEVLLLAEVGLEDEFLKVLGEHVVDLPLGDALVALLEQDHVVQESMNE